MAFTPDRINPDRLQVHPNVEIYREGLNTLDTFEDTGPIIPGGILPVSFGKKPARVFFGEELHPLLSTEDTHGKVLKREHLASILELVPGNFLL